MKINSRDSINLLLLIREHEHFLRRSFPIVCFSVNNKGEDKNFEVQFAFSSR